MKKVILDTSFILTCLKQKIDFFEELHLMGLSIVIPKQVIEELELIREKNKGSELALDLLEKSDFKSIDLGTKNVDKGIIKFSNENTDFYVATLDREIKNKIKNSKIVIREKKRLEVI